jgi:NADH dehydrogenase
VGPESHAYAELVRIVRDAIGVRTPLLPVPPAVVWLAGRIAGACVGDIVLTRDEIRGLRKGLLDTSGPATGSTRFSGWVRESSRELGRTYASELARHWRLTPGGTGDRKAPDPGYPAGKDSL